MLYTLHILTTDKAARAVRQRIAFRLVGCISLLYRTASKHSLAQDIIIWVWSTANTCTEKPSCATFSDYPTSDGQFSVEWLFINPAVCSLFHPIVGWGECVASDRGHHMLTPWIKGVFSLECTMRQMWLMCLWVLSPITRNKLQLGLPKGSYIIWSDSR